MGRATDRRHLLVKSQCFAQFGIRSAACTLMFPQQSLETKRCENIREPDSTNWGVRHAAHPSLYRRWTKYSNPFYPVQPPPSPPKFNVIVTWNALAPMDEKNQTPNITFANTRAETLRFGGAGVQHIACCRVWIFCPSTVVNAHHNKDPGQVTANSKNRSIDNLVGSLEHFFP